MIDLVEISTNEIHIDPSLNRGSHSKVFDDHLMASIAAIGLAAERFALMVCFDSERFSVSEKRTQLS